MNAILLRWKRNPGRWGLEALKGIALHAVELVCWHDHDESIIPGPMGTVATLIAKEKRTRKAERSGFRALESPW